LQAGGHRFDPGWLHVVAVNANRWHAECRLDVIASVHADWLDVIAGVYTDCLDEAVEDRLGARRGGLRADQRCLRLRSTLLGLKSVSRRGTVSDAETRH
jgi:hypothetical protein